MACIAAHDAIAQDSVPGDGALSLTRGDGAGNCLDAEALQTAIEARLGRPAFGRDAATRVAVTLRHPGGTRWEARIRFSNAAGRATGERHLNANAPDCNPLASAVVLSIALTLGDEQSIVESAPEPAVAASHATAPVVASVDDAPEVIEPVRTPAPPVQLIPRTRVIGTIGLRGAAMTGLLPGFALGFGATFGFRFGRAPMLEAGVWYWPERSLPVGAQGGSVGITLATVSLATCPALLTARWFQLQACGGAQIGTLTGAGHRLPWNDRFDRWFVALEAGTRVVGESGPLRAEVALDLGVPLIRDTFSVDGFGPVHAAAPLYARIGFGIGLNFE